MNLVGLCVGKVIILVYFGEVCVGKKLSKASNFLWDLFSGFEMMRRSMKIVVDVKLFTLL